MFDYTGHECFSCKKRFTAEDDVVVCPECGTPYHRECWKKEGKCINFSLHENHISWKSDIEQKAKSSDAPLFCKSCGNKLRADQLFCDRCGMPTEVYIRSNDERAAEDYPNEDMNNSGEKLNEAFFPYMVNFSYPLCGFNPNEEYEGGLTTRDLGDFVGKSTHFYLPKFKLMKTGHFKISMNIPALFFPEYYFAYRKMPAAALLILILKTAVGLPSLALSMQTLFTGTDQTSIMFQSMMKSYPEFSGIAEKMSQINLDTNSFAMLYNISGLLDWIMIILFGSLANYMYYRFTIKKASALKNAAISNEMDVSQTLRENGGTSIPMLLLFFFISFILSSLSTYLVIYLL